MSDVEFTDEKQNQDYQKRFSQPAKRTSGAVTNLVKKWGLAKDEKSANRLFVIIICVCLVIICILWFTKSSNNSSQISSKLQAEEAVIEAKTPRP